MPYHFSRLSESELLELAACLSNVLPLVIKARSAGLSMDEERELRMGMERILGLLGIATPLGGWLAAEIAARRPGPIMRMTGIPNAVDKLLELLLVLSQAAVRAELDLRISGGSLLSSNDIYTKMDDGRVGFLCEALGRLWLKEIIGGVWSTARYEIIEDRDIDALAEQREGERLHLYVAEIKRTLREDDVNKIVELVRGLKKLYSPNNLGWKTIRSSHIKSLYVIDFSKGQKKNIEEELRNHLSNIVEEVRIISLYELKESCRKYERVGHTLLESIELLEERGIIGY